MRRARQSLRAIGVAKISKAFPRNSPEPIARDSSPPDAIRASGNQGSYWLNLASFYKRQKRLNEMEAAISSAIAADKKRPNVLFDAAQILFGAGRNFVGAANCVRKYLAGGSTVEEAPAFQAHYLLGLILEKQGDKAGAAAEFKAALALASTTPVTPPTVFTEYTRPSDFSPVRERSRR